MVSPEEQKSKPDLLSSNRESHVQVPDELRAEIARKIGPSLSNIDPQTKQLIVERTLEVAVQFSGPIPPGPLLREYDVVVPGSADRIIAMAEREQEHQHAMERAASKNPFVLEMVGLVLGATVTCVGLALGAYCIVKGFTLAGLSLFGATLGTIVITLVNGRGNGNVSPKGKKSPDQGRKRK
jgi:uncharacterized membrane protein